MDSDILVTTDLKELYDTNLGKNSTGMVENVEALPYVKKYYNSGVILMDLKKWREQNIQAKLIEFLDKNIKDFIPNSTCKYYYADQDLLNIVLADSIYTLSKRWNLQCVLGEMPNNASFNGIIHYIGDNKPWVATLSTIYQYKRYYENWFHSPVFILWFVAKYMYVIHQKECLYTNMINLFTKPINQEVYSEKDLFKIEQFRTKKMAE